MKIIFEKSKNIKKRKMLSITEFKECKTNNNKKIYINKLSKE